MAAREPAPLASEAPAVAAAPAATTPTPSATEATQTAARELAVAAREVNEAARKPTSVAPPAPAVSSPPPVALGSVELSDAVYPWTYDGVMSWLENNRDAAPRFAAGDVIRQSDLAKLRPFLPPGYYEQFDFPGVQVEIQATGQHTPHRSYQNATFQYRGQPSIEADGSIANYTAGRPFSEEQILAASPRDAGLMVGWNNIFRWQHFGYRAGPIPMIYMVPGTADEKSAEYAEVLTGGGRIERSVVTDYQRVYLSHQAALADQNYELDIADARKQYFKDWMQFTDPFDMRGMAFVFERFRDPHEPDQVNSYLPTERRIRRLSAKERSDSFVGSEMTMDDFEGFSGRVLDYEWEYRGQKDVLHVADSGHPRSLFFGPQSWLANDRWQLRRCHVVETKPIYEGHPYGRKLTFYDAETFGVAATVIFDHQDRLFKIIYTIYKWPGGDPDGDPAETVSHWRSSVAINVQSERAMVSWSEKTEIPDMKASQVRRLFSVSSLTGGR